MKHYFEGRIARLNYFVAGIALSISLSIVSSILNKVVGGVGANLVVGLITLAAFMLSLSLMLRRFHDMGWSGWHSLWMIVPLVNIVFCLMLLFKRGTAGDNQYGKDPEKEVRLWESLFPKAPRISSPQPL